MIESEDELRLISEASEHDISKELYRLSEQGYFTVFPVGFRAAGKTMLMSSIFRYAERNASKPFKVDVERRFPFNSGFKLYHKMVTEFEPDYGNLMGRNAAGTLELFGLNLNPNHNKLPSVKLNFIDVAGEDIEKIRVESEAQLTKKIKAVFKALELQKTPCVFLLVTPFESSEKRGDLDEDTLQSNFISFLKSEYPNLYKSSKIFVIVTKWDQNIDSKYSPEKFIVDRRPSLYSYIKDTSAVYGAYSIGNVLETNEGDIVKASLVSINEDYPFRFWNKLYETYTRNGLIYKTWWQRLFS
jgi:hypothetical protein